MNFKGIFVLLLVVMIGVVSCGGNKNPVEPSISQEEEINWEEARKRVELIAEALRVSLDANKNESSRLKSPVESSSSPSFAPTYELYYPPDEDGWYAIDPIFYDIGLKSAESKVRYLDENGEPVKLPSDWWEYDRYILETSPLNEERKETLVYYSGKVIRGHYLDRYVNYYDENNKYLYFEFYRDAQMEVFFPVSPVSGETGGYTVTFEIDSTYGGGRVEYNKKDRSDTFHTWGEYYFSFVTSDNWRGKMERTLAKKGGQIINDKGVKVADIITDEYGNFYYRLLNDPADKWQWIGVWI